jgi:F-type H+-transporting ATPase subunit delta
MASNLRLSHRYALALKQLSDERGETPTLYNEFKKLHDLVKASDDLRIFLRSPVIKPDVKVKALEKVMGGNISRLLKLFIDKLTKARRENLLGEIAHDFVAMCDKASGRALARLQVAWPASQEFKDEITKKVLHQLSTEGIRSLEIEEIVRPELIGGFILQVGDKRLDASYAGKLNQLKRQFSQNLYVKEF